jgi:membrane protein DedA with SNARE-associated domain
MSVLDTLVLVAEQVVDAVGNVGLAGVMAAEAVLPIPSEVVLPMVGAQLSDGQVPFFVAVLAATIGSTLGSWAVYTVGRLGGRSRVQRLARLLGLDDERWAWTEDRFSRHGNWVILLGRLVPGVRCLVSLPAGSLGMSTPRFLALTAAGSAVWNAVWIGGGSFVADKWSTLLAALADARPAVLAAAATGVAVVLVQQTRVRSLLW